MLLLLHNGTLSDSTNGAYTTRNRGSGKLWHGIYPYRELLRVVGTYRIAGFRSLVGRLRFLSPLPAPLLEEEV